MNPEMVRFRPEIEPVVRWIEETPRERILEKAVAELKEGLSYRSLLSGLFLAGIRNIKPRPVGFKFHAVMVINSAHLLGQSAAVTERLLPLFWALDNFKSSQAADVREGDWTLSRVDESRVPKPHRARADYIRAMEAWDEGAADAAVSGLCRGSGAAECMEPVWRMAVRDQRNIGHKPIFAAQSVADPRRRSAGRACRAGARVRLAFGLLDRAGRSGPDAVWAPTTPNLEARTGRSASWLDKRGEADRGSDDRGSAVRRSAGAQPSRRRRRKAAWMLLNGGDQRRGRSGTPMAARRGRVASIREPGHRGPARDQRLGERPALHLRGLRRRADTAAGACSQGAGWQRSCYRDRLHRLQRPAVADSTR